MKKVTRRTWPSRMAEFYERAGYVKCLGDDNRYGSHLGHRRCIPARR